MAEDESGLPAERAARSIDERLRRWRLALGASADEPIGVSLGDRERAMDRALEALYDAERKGDLSASSPAVARWLGDIREYFPSPVVRVLQKDAFERLDLKQMLFEKEMLEAVEPDVHLVATLLSLGRVLPARTRETARQVVRKVVDELERKLRNPLEQAVRSALQRSTRVRRPRVAEVDWHRTIRKNLSRWQPERQAIVVEEMVGYGRKRSSLRDVVLCVDQSGSMATSVVYAGIFGAVLASIRSLTTRMVVFDTSVVDLTDEMRDPVDLLFGIQLGGGTDIARALAYCEQIISRPAQTVLVLVTDLFEGGDPRKMIQRASTLKQSGVNVVCLLALNDKGAPAYHGGHAENLAALGIPSFACTPEQFPDLMSTALERRDLSRWAARHGIATARPVP
ncbi:MAG: VWA domain-containing protein [Myxococcales bacterium]